MSQFEASQDVKPNITEKIQLEVNFEGRRAFARVSHVCMFRRSDALVVAVKFKLKKTNSLRKVLETASVRPSLTRLLGLTNAVIPCPETT